MKEEFNRHHLIPSSKWGLTTSENIKRVELKEHARWHTRCGNDTPVEALCRVLLWNDKIWSDNFKADWMAVLDNYINNYYQKHTNSWYIKSEIFNILNLEEKLR